MKILRQIIRLYLIFQYFLLRITFTGPFGRDGASYIIDDKIEETNNLKRHLKEHHVKQFNEASCSVASVVSVINSVKDFQGTAEGEGKLTQKGILEKVKACNWKKRMEPGGDNGRRGLPLEILGEVIKDSLNTYDVRYKSVDIVQAVKSGADKNIIKSKLRERLKSFESDGNCVIFAHFNQGAYVKTVGLPHISPVGGFDEKKDTVTILDVDPEQNWNYEVSFDRFYKGLADNYNNMFSAFGYKSGGYVFVQL